MRPWVVLRLCGSLNLSGAAEGFAWLTRDRSRTQKFMRPHERLRRGVLRMRYPEPELYSLWGVC